MYKIGRLLIALGILLSGTILTAYATLPSEKIGWETYGASYIYEPFADLSVIKSASPAPVLLEEALTYVVVVNNSGPDKATGVRLTDTLPVSVTFNSVTSSQGECNESSRIVTCDLGTLFVNDAVTVTLLVTPVMEGFITNMANVSGNELDPNPDNNEDVMSISVTGEHYYYVYLPTVMRSK